jgi:hypothetical protein
MKKNFESVYFLRNRNIYQSHEDALNAINANAHKVDDGESMLARYYDDNNDVKTIVGYKYGDGSIGVIMLIEYKQYNRITI